MQRPKCKNNGSRVADSRPADDGRSIRSQKQAKNGYQVRLSAKVIKRNGIVKNLAVKIIKRTSSFSRKTSSIAWTTRENIVNEIERSINQEGEK